MFQSRATRILFRLSHSIPKNHSTKTNTRTLITSTISTTFNNNHHYNAQRNLSTAKLIQELRKATGAPMVECKKAISDPEVNGDFTKATEWLRKHGSAKMSSKLAGRDASEGLVGISFKDNIATIVRVNSETDFASRSIDFNDLVETVANASLDVPTSKGVISVDELKEVSIVKETLDNTIVSIRENLQIASATKITSSKPNSSIITGYVHGKIFHEKSVGTAAAIVELAPIIDGDKVTKTKEEIIEIGRKIAMHIVAARPDYLKSDDVPVDIVQKEKDLLMEQMVDSGKPKEILEKIVNGRMSKFYEGVCLLEQGHMLEEGNPKISKVLKNDGLELVTFKYVAIQ